MSWGKNRYERRHPQGLPLYNTKEEAQREAANWYGAAFEHHVAQYVGWEDGKQVSKWAVEE